MFAELPAPACLGAVSVWVQLFAGLADSMQALLGCSFPISTFQSLNGLDRVLEIVSRLLDSLEQGGWSCRTWCLLQPRTALAQSVPWNAVTAVSGSARPVP